MAHLAKGYRIRIQQEAIDELDEIYRYIFRDSPTHARIHIRNLKNKIRSLRTFPRRGSRARLLEDHERLVEIRFIGYKGYLVFYTIDKNEVIILHISSPGQNWIDLFL
jgi:plasmid stabilization system protein ParE